MYLRGLALRFIVLLGAVMAPGCQQQVKKDRPACYPVSGKVVIDGMPAVRTIVAFYPKTPQFEKKEFVGQTLTDDNGEFQVTTFTAGDGLPSGEYIVTLEANWVSREGQDVSVPDLLKGKYADRRKSTLKATVETKPLVLEPYNLKTM